VRRGARLEPLAQPSGPHLQLFPSLLLLQRFTTWLRYHTVHRSNVYVVVVLVVVVVVIVAIVVVVVVVVVVIVVVVVVIVVVVVVIVVVLVLVVLGVPGGTSSNTSTAVVHQNHPDNASQQTRCIVS
jgi:glucan phosphoethanolaminetransferase (alkaline phosphatase superfamily)